MTNPDERLLVQLRSIRNILLLATLCLVSLVGVNIYYIIHGIKTDKEARLGYTFADQADSLYQAQEWNELLTLALKRQREKPRDAGAFFWAGIASFNLEQFDQAEESFRQALHRDRRREKTVQAWLKALNEKRQSLKKPSMESKSMESKSMESKPIQHQSIENKSIKHQNSEKLQTPPTKGKGREVILTDPTLYRTVWGDHRPGSVFIFQPGGVLQYTQDNRLKGTGTWKTKGNSIVIELGSFTRYTGVRRKNIMEGSAENALNQKWKWKLTRQL